MSDTPIDNRPFPFHRPFETPITSPPAAAHGIALYSPEAASTVALPPKHPHSDELFHAPAPPPASLCPQRFPGADPESTEALIKCLSQNHILWHIFFNYRSFHNHIAHHLLAIWAMGASGKVIEAAYGTHYVYQRPAFESPNPITHANIHKHLGDERYYSAYLQFFTTAVLKKGLTECLEEYFFSSTTNFASDDGGEHPAMLSRLMGGIFHPFIHTGYAAEFGLTGIAAEALAQAAVHPAAPELVDKAWFLDDAAKTGGTRNALTILSLISCDPRLANVQLKPGNMLAGGAKEYGPIIWEYVRTWKLDVASDVGIASAIEELSWMNSIIYGVGGYLSMQEFNANFLLMHLLTSSIFLPSVLAIIPKSSSRRMMLWSYFIAVLVFYVARHRPKIDVRAFYEGTEHLLHKVPGPSTSPARETLPEPSSNLAQTPNTWLPLIQSALVHPNEHLCKAQRALAHHSAVYGQRKKGWTEKLSAQEDKEAEGKLGLAALDGTLFLRIAMLTQNRLGWMREGEPKQEWDF